MELSEDGKKAEMAVVLALSPLMDKYGRAAVAEVISQIASTLSFSEFVPYDCERCGVHISKSSSGGPVCLKCKAKERRG